MTAFRCATASRARGDELAGTASTVRSYLLLEHPGPWGTDALRDARLPDGLGAHLEEQARRHRVRVLLVRREDLDRLQSMAKSNRHRIAQVGRQIPE